MADGRLLLVPIVLGYRRTRAGADSTGRARLELALVDVRAGRLLWRGRVYGETARADAPRAVATLSQNLVRTLTR